MPDLLLPIIAASTPYQVTGINTPLFFRNCTFFGYKSFNASGIPINNTSTVYFGINSGRAAMQVTAGSSSQYVIPTTQERDNLGNYWFQSATSGDALYIVYN